MREEGEERKKKIIWDELDNSVTFLMPQRDHTDEQSATSDGGRRGGGHSAKASLSLSTREILGLG